MHVLLIALLIMVLHLQIGFNTNYATVPILPKASRAVFTSFSPSSTESVTKKYNFSNKINWIDCTSRILTTNSTKS